MAKLSFLVSNNRISIESNSAKILNEIKEDWFTKAHLPGFRYSNEEEAGNTIQFSIIDGENGSEIDVKYKDKEFKKSIADNKKIRARDVILLSLQFSTYANELKNVFTGHASFIRKGDSGVLLCGGTGSGKTLLSLAARTHGWEGISNEFTSFDSDLRNVSNITMIRASEQISKLLGLESPDIEFEDIVGIRIKLVVFLKLYDNPKAYAREVSAPDKYFYLYETFSRITKAVDNLMTDGFDVPYFNLDDEISSKNRAKFVKTLADKAKVISVEGNFNEAVKILDDFV